MAVAVDVTDMFTEFDIISLQLMMLAADRPLDPLPGLQFELRPMEIKTLVATVVWK